MKQQKLSLITVMLMSINIMIGAGVLLAPGIMASVAGNASFIGWIIAALFYIPIVYGVSQLATLMPGEGGIYRYARKVFGEKIGFFCGWLYYLSYILIATTVLSGLRTSLLARYPHIAFFNSPALFLALCLALITSLNMMRISVIGSIQKYLTITKLLPIILAIVLIPFFIKWDFTISIPEIKSLFSPGGLTMAIFGFVGFEFACSLSHEIEGGAKKASLAVMGAFGTVLTIYILFHFGLLHIMGANNLALYTAAGFAPFVGTKFPALSGFLTVLINLATTVCFMSGANGLITLTTEIMQSLAKGGIMRGTMLLTQQNSEGRPWLATLTSAGLLFGFGVLTPNTESLASAGLFGICSSLAIAMISLFVAQKNRKNNFGMLIATLGFIVAVGLAASNVIGAGTNLAQRLITFSPLIIGLIIGLAFMNPYKNKG